MHPSLLIARPSVWWTSEPNTCPRSRNGCVCMCASPEHRILITINILIFLLILLQNQFEPIDWIDCRINKKNLRVSIEKSIAQHQSLNTKINIKINTKINVNQYESAGRHLFSSNIWRMLFCETVPCPRVPSPESLLFPCLFQSFFLHPSARDQNSFSTS